MKNTLYIKKLYSCDVIVVNRLSRQVIVFEWAHIKTQSPDDNSDGGAPGHSQQAVEQTSTIMYHNNTNNNDDTNHKVCVLNRKQNKH